MRAAGPGSLRSRGYAVLTGVTAGIALASIAVYVGPAFRGETPAAFRVAVGGLGLAAGVLMWARPQRGWLLGLVWALVQIPYYAWSTEGSPTAQIVRLVLGGTREVTVNGVTTSYTSIGINFVGVILAGWLLASRPRGAPAAAAAPRPAAAEPAPEPAFVEAEREAEAAEFVAETGGYAPSVAERLAIYQRAGGIVTPILTAIFAFFMGGIVVLATGHNPLRTYWEIFKGTGLDWFFRFGNYHIDIPFTDRHVFFWWNTAVTPPNTDPAAYNLSQTLLLTTTLVLTGLAVAFAFRCGLFNIGGQGQYLIGAITGIWIGTRVEGLAHWQHVLFAIVAASLAGAAFAAVAGFLKATTGAHEVITTIMLNWIAYWLGNWAFGQGGPLQNGVNPSVPVSDDVLQTARLPTLWGLPVLQGLHVGFFVSLGMLVVFWLVLNRTTLGYEVRAVGFNPEAARYGGISVARNYVIAMAISGFFAGLAGVMDMVGFQFRLGVLDVQTSTIGFIGIAVALLGRNTAVGTLLAALLFASLIYGTSTRSLDPDVFPPELAGNLTLMIQALVLLFVGADVLILYLWQARRRVFGRRAEPAAAPTRAR